MIEGYLDQLNAQRKMLLILKAHRGYSAVVLDQTEYREFLLRYHHNGETVEEAIRSAAANPEKSD